MENPPNMGRTIVGLALLLFLVPFALVVFGISDDPNPLWIWLAVGLSMLGLVIGLGLIIAERWDGVLIDYRNKVSLARLQVTLWTLVILSAWFTIAIVRSPGGAVEALDPDSPAVVTCREAFIADESERRDLNFGLPENADALEAAEVAAVDDCGRDVLNISLPREIWLALGISVGSLAGSGLVKSSKRQADRLDLKVDEGHRPAGSSEAVRVASPEFADMFRGDDKDTREKIDISKVQMFFFTVVLVVAYGSMTATMLGTPAEIYEAIGVSMPAFSNSMNVLLAISHAGYLTVKATDPSS
ncbi:MAG: hypothetical protein AAF531_00710 [Actinomycetota bacterium]